jgi:hypothetical protein
MDGMDLYRSMASSTMPDRPHADMALVRRVIIAAT